tara:strand:- start:1167 stop:1793 length:627 start_codon:yes stop_codon:yes gene_type:complete
MTQYYSKTKQDYVNINDMHHQHVWYAFKKLCDRLEELGICEHIWEDDYAFWNQHKFVRKDVYELMFDKATRQDNTIEHLLNKNSKLKKNANSKMVFKLEQEVSRLRKELKRLTKTNKDMYHSYFNPHLKNKGHRYVFSNIPNDDNGRSLVKTMRFYLNKDTYNMRVRGQYLDKSKLERGESWRTYDDGQPLSKSKCIRLYIDKKRESA